MDILVDVVPYAVGAGAIALSVFSYFKIGNKSVNTNIENETQQSGEGNISQAAGHDIVNIKIEHAAVPMEGKKMESRVNKDSTRILFIDDDTRFKIVTMLKKQGWVHTSIMKDLKNFEAPKFKEANVVFVDIQGVGKDMGFGQEGLGLADAIKEKFPDKKVVIYSAEKTGDRFHKALQKADASLSKDADLYEFELTLEEVLSDG